jgi:transcriptional regulator with XRE-family HTH domain
MNVVSECIVVTGPIPQTITWTAEVEDHQVPIASTVAVALPPGNPEPLGRPLHRLGEVRRREGLSRYAIARRMRISVGKVEEQEDPSCDMRLSDLQRWQQALNVPVAELLNEPEGELSQPIQLRAHLLKAMKTVRSIQQRARQATLQRLAQTLVNQLLELMPELEGIAPWPTVGIRRRKTDLGQAFLRRIALDPLDELEGPDF